MAPAQRTTSIRDANVTMLMGGEPIITPATKVTRAEPVPGRFEFAAARVAWSDHQRLARWGEHETQVPPMQSISKRNTALNT